MSEPKDHSFTPRWPPAEGVGQQGFRPDTRFAARLPQPETVQGAPDSLAPDPVEQARADGFDEGYARGYDAACAEAETRAREEARGREAITLALHRMDERLVEDLRQRLITTVQALCETSLLPLAIDPAGLAARAQKAAALFARAGDERVICIHPDDLALIHDRLPADTPLREDATLERGALRIETPHGGLEDGPEQWKRAIAEELGRC